MRTSPRALTLAAAAAVVALTASGAGSADRCTRPDTSPHWDAVFGHATSISQAVVIRRQAERFGFRGFVFEQDYCDDVQVSVPGFDTPQARRDLAEEALSVGLQVSFEPPETFKQPRAGIVKAVFGIRPTLARADRLRQVIAGFGWREGADIERLGYRDWRVLVHGIPTAGKAGFAAEARRVGFKVVFVSR